MKIVEAHIIKRFKIHLLFENNVSGIVDLSDLAGRGVFKSWMQPGIFEQMELTTDGFLLWPGELDLCPDSLYLKLTSKQELKSFPSLSQNKNLAYA